MNTDENGIPDPTEAAAVGAEWLDQNGPAEWWDRIDYNTLDMFDGTRCVLGQVYAADADVAGISCGYFYAYDMVTEGVDSSVERGFATATELYSDLRTAWINECENRRVMVNA